jgi:RNA polymerase sigma factor (TIGR02999 family)
MDDLQALAGAIARDDLNTPDRLLPPIYDRLRRLAAALLVREAPGQTLDATALVHEAYLRLAAANRERYWAGCRHFFTAAAEAMRRILVENARRKGRVKHGGGRRRVPLQPGDALEAGPAEDLVALDEALELLHEEDPQKAQLVRLRFFGGLTAEQSARCLGISRATVERHWAYARAWLYDWLRSSQENQPG